jgi:membrane protease YdiL (CAAX protease family)
MSLRSVACQPDTCEESMPLSISRPSVLRGVLTIPYCVLLVVILGWLRVASGSVWVVTVAHASLDVSSSDGVAVLAPGFDFAVAGGAALLGSGLSDDVADWSPQKQS